MCHYHDRLLFSNNEIWKQNKSKPETIKTTTIPSIKKYLHTEIVTTFFWHFQWANNYTTFEGGERKKELCYVLVLLATK